VRWIAPGIWFHLNGMLASGYCSAIGKPFASFVVLLAGALSHVIMIYIFVFVLDMGFDGVLLATSL